MTRWSNPNGAPSAAAPNARPAFTTSPRTSRSPASAAAIRPQGHQEPAARVPQRRPEGGAGHHRRAARRGPLHPAGQLPGGPRRSPGVRRFAAPGQPLRPQRRADHPGGLRARRHQGGWVHRPTAAPEDGGRGQRRRHLEALHGRDQEPGCAGRRRLPVHRPVRALQGCVRRVRAGRREDPGAAHLLLRHAPPDPAPPRGGEGPAADHRPGQHHGLPGQEPGLCRAPGGSG